MSLLAILANPNRKRKKKAAPKKRRVRASRKNPLTTAEARKLLSHAKRVLQSARDARYATTRNSLTSRAKGILDALEMYGPLFMAAEVGAVQEAAMHVSANPKRKRKSRPKAKKNPFYEVRLQVPRSKNLLAVDVAAKNRDEARRKARGMLSKEGYHQGRVVEVRKLTVKEAMQRGTRMERVVGPRGVLQLKHPNPRRSRRNPDDQIYLPFKKGKKYSVERIDTWVNENGTPQMIKRWNAALAQYKRFHKGSKPKFVTYNLQKIGSHAEVNDVEFGVSEGKEWAAMYQVPGSSGKHGGDGSDGRYIHAHGGSNIDLDIKKAVSRKKLPDRFHTPDGGFVGVIPSKNVKITDWYRG